MIQAAGKPSSASGQYYVPALSGPLQQAAWQTQFPFFSVCLSV